MDKSWITMPKGTDEYKEGLNRFLDLAMDQNSVEGRIMCPCRKCKFKKWLTRDEAYDHLMRKQFPTDYIDWVWHGEDTLGATSSRNCDRKSGKSLLIDSKFYRKFDL